jgi:Ca2+-binding RTX toxin-like protein
MKPTNVSPRQAHRSTVDDKPENAFRRAAARRLLGLPLRASLVTAATVGAVLAAAVPPSASASMAARQVGGGGVIRLVYTADEPEANRVSISRDAVDYLVEDTAAVITVGDGCSTVDAQHVRCSAEGIQGITVELGGEDDVLTIADPAYPPGRPPNGSSPVLVLGGAGSDAVTGGSGEDEIDGEGGNDNLSSGGGSDILFGAVGDDTLDAGPGDDRRVNGEEGDDDVFGGPGDDNLVGDLGSDVLEGGDGTDTADYGQRKEPLSIDLDGDRDDGESGERDNVQRDIERVIGGSNGDTLTGSGAANVLDGREGEDTIEGLGGDDTLLGGTNDPSGDNVSGGSGNDTIMGESGDDALVGGVGDDTESGGGGSDRVEGEAGNDSLTGGAGADTVDGGEGDDKLNGGEIALVGGDAADELIGGTGTDELRGGRGNDLLDGGLGPDYIDGESETDTVTYEDRTNKVFVTLDGQNNDGERDEQDNVVNVEKIVGGILGDDLSGDAGGNTIAGERGQDLIRGHLGPDRLLGGAAADVVVARDGVPDDVVACGSGKDFAIADDRDKVIECDTVDRPSTRRPIVGRYALVRPRGEFRLRLPQEPRFFPLAEEVKIRIGSTIDPKADVVSLTTARNRKGAHQVASVSAGRFTLRQGKGRRAVTTLRLAGKLPRCRGSSTRRANAKQPARQSTRRLRVEVGNKRRGKNPSSKSRRGKDPGRRLRVRGRYSAAGSRGTEWITEDTCEGTLTSVISGTVRVRDLVRGKTVTVGAGDTYLAAP